MRLSLPLTDAPPTQVLGREADTCCPAVPVTVRGRSPGEQPALCGQAMTSACSPSLPRTVDASSEEIQKSQVVPVPSEGHLDRA